MKTTPEHPSQGQTFYRYFSTGFFIGITLAAFFVARESGNEWISSTPVDIQNIARTRFSPSNAELQSLLLDAPESSTREKTQNRLPANAP